MSVTIDSLDIQIKSSAGSASKNIEKLAKALGELNSNSNVSKITKSLEKLNKANNSVVKNLKIADIKQALDKVTDAFSAAIKEAVQWEGIVSRFGRAFGEEADIVYEHIQKISDAFKINKQEFMQYSSLYGSLLSGFGMGREQASAVAVGLTELSYDIWAANNDRYKTLEEAAEALRSAITGEIEPARNAGIALSNAALQEYLDTHGKLGVSFNELTEAQKAEVRYAKMVNDAMNQGIVGTYAGEMDTAEGVLRTLNQELKTLGQAIGSLVLPIIKEVIPWVSAFVELLTEGVVALGDMFGIKVQEGSKQTANNMESMVESAKKIKQYTAGFDELNIIGGSSESETGADGSGGSLGLTTSAMWDDSVFKLASQQIDDLKQKIKDYVTEHQNMLAVVGTVTAFTVFAQAVERLNTALGLSGLCSAIGNAAGNLWILLGWLKEGNSVTTVLSVVLPKLTGALTSIAGIFGAPVWAAAAVIIGAIASVVYYLYNNWQSVVNVAKAFFESNVVPKLEAIKESWDKIKEALSPVSALFESVGVVFEAVGGIIFNVLASQVAGAFNAVMSIIEGFVQAVSGIVQIVSGVVEFVVKLFTGDLRGAFLAISDAIGGVIDLFAGLYDMTIGAVIEFVDGVIDWFYGLWDELVGHSIVPDMINAIVDWFAGLPGRVFGYVEEFANGVIKRCKELWTNVKEWYKSTIAPKFTASYWVNVFSNLKVGFTQTIKNMLNSGIDMLNKFIGWINSKLKFSWDGLSIAGKQIFPGGSVQLFTIPAITQRFASGGFIEDGLFTMNHGEIAGKFNNGKSVVANNEQIISGIATGVETANENLITAFYAMGQQIIEAINAKDTATYIDTKRITAAQTQRSRAYGV